MLGSKKGALICALSLVAGAPALAQPPVTSTPPPPTPTPPHIPHNTPPPPPPPPNPAPPPPQHAPPPALAHQPDTVVPRSRDVVRAALRRPGGGAGPEARAGDPAPAFDRPAEHRSGQGSDPPARPQPGVPGGFPSRRRHRRRAPSGDPGGASDERGGGSGGRRGAGAAAALDRRQRQLLPSDRPRLLQRSQQHHRALPSREADRRAAEPQPERVRFRSELRARAG